MVIEKKKVKGVTKKYKSKKTKVEKKTIVKSVYLGTDSDFDVNEDVVVISSDEFKRITDSKGTNEELEKELQEKGKQIEDLFITITNLEKDIEKLRITNDDYSKTIKELNEKNRELQGKNSNVLEELNSSKNVIILLQKEDKTKDKAMKYLQDVIKEYKHLNLFERIFKKDAKDKVPIPEDIPTELIDKK